MGIYIIIGIMVIFGVLLHDIPREISHRRIDGPALPENGIKNSGYAIFGSPVGSNRFPLLWTHYYWIVVVSLILMAGLRYRIGFDTAAIQLKYLLAPEIPELSIDSFDRYSGGRHVFLYSLCKTAGVGIWPIQLLCAATLNYALGKFIKRNTRCIFVALGLYLCLLYIPLNFELMYQGMAAGLILIGMEALKKDRYLKFYCFLLLGACVHLSALSMIWLPLLTVKKVKDSINGYRGGIFLVSALLVIGLSGCWILKDIGEWESGLPILDTLEINAKGLRVYAAEMFNGPGLNAKGVLRRLYIYVLIPGIAWRMLRGKGERTYGEPTMARSGFYLTIMLVYVAFQLMSFEAQVFQRLGYYLAPVAIVGVADSMRRITSTKGFVIWWMGILFMTSLMMYHYCGLPDRSKEGRLYEIYMPYASVVDKGISHHREWIYMNRYRALRNLPPLREDEFYFSCGEGEVYLDGPIYDATGRKDTHVDD